MKKRFVSAILIACLFVPEILMAHAETRPVPAANAQPARPAPPSAQNNAAQPREGVRPQSTSQRRSYERETHRRRHRSGISKKEVVFMAAIAGTSMGIGALAAGAKGVAIGAIVGGWGAYAGHRLWNWIR